MKMYWVKTRWFIKKIFSRFVWDMCNATNTVYLTFDDGPTPEVTEWVLSVLKEHNIKATFFCIGNNIEKHPDIFKKVIDEGHTIANHTFNHLNGWNTSNQTYLENIDKTESLIAQYYSSFKNNKLFRPPYGRMKSSQAKEVLKKGYKIIMWDVLSADFDKTITPEKCLENITKNTRNGSIIIFHDSVKAYPNLKHALPSSIKYLKEKGFSFGVVS